MELIQTRRPSDVNRLQRQRNADRETPTKEDQAPKRRRSRHRNHATQAQAQDSNSSSNDNNNNNHNNRTKNKVDPYSRDHDASSGFEVAWLNFSYSVGPNWLEDPKWGRINSLFHKEQRNILRELSGNFRSGQLVALMGPSGAGKTCLLECIAGVRRTGIDGRLSVRGRKKLQLVMVPQYDNFLPQFTVEEIVAYGSKMKNSRTANHRAIVDKVIEQLGLKNCRSTKIQRCSGGQQKRVAIAQELVSKPNVLILDEPTSGLDSSCCYQTMKVLRDVLNESVRSDEPMAIVTTIHQPSAKVFHLFDLVYILGKTGKLTYSGRPDKLPSTIKQITGLECPQYSNPSDYMIELASYDYGQEPVDKLIEFEEVKAKRLARLYDRRCAGDLSTLTETGDNRKEPSVGPVIGEPSTANGNCSSEQSSDQTTQMISELPLIYDQCNGRVFEDISSDSSSSSSSLDLSHSHNLTCRSSSHSSSHVEGFNECEILHLHDQDCQSIEINLNDDLPDDLLGINCSSDRDYVIYKNNIITDLGSATSNRHHRHPFFWHTYVHFHRSFVQSIRDPILNNMRILIHLVFATLLILLYGQKSGEARGCPPILGLPAEITDPNNELMVDLSDNVGYLFMCIMMITYVSLMSMVLTFPIDIKTVGKEYKNGWYGTISYFIGKNIADLPFIIVYPVLYCCITWFGTHQAQDHGWRFLSFTGLIIMNAMNSQSFGLILGALFVNSVTAATFLGPVITTPWYLFTGFTKRIYRLAFPFKYASKFLFTRYVFEGLLDTVYGHQRCNCSQFVEKYYQLREEEVARLGQIISDETLSSLDYYDGIDYLQQQQWLDRLTSNSTGSQPMATGDPRGSLVSSAGQAVAMSLVSGTGSDRSSVASRDSYANLITDPDQLDLTSLMESNGRASSLFSFGLDFEPTCPSDYKNFIIQDFHLDDMTTKRSFLYCLMLLLFIRVLTLIVVTWKIRNRQL